MLTFVLEKETEWEDTEIASSKKHEESFTIQIEDDVEDDIVTKKQSNTYAAKKTVAQGKVL